MLVNLLQRLAQMFPGSNYQSRLEQYIVNRHPQNTADIEMLERQYYQDQQRGIVWNISEPYMKQWSEIVNIKHRHTAVSIATTDLHRVKHVAINIVNAKSQNIL